MSYDYENGAYSRIPLRWNEAESTLTIGEREGSFEGMDAERHFLVCLTTPSGTRTPVVVEYDGSETSIKL